MISRRGFLVAGAAAVSAGAAGWGLVEAYRATDRSAPLALPDAPPGPIGAATVAALIAAAEAVIGFPLERAHYAEYFRWRAEHLGGYAALYRHFETVADREAVRRWGRAFAACPASRRREILDRVAGPRGRGGSRRNSLGAQVAHYILREALVLWARTDAWTALGYDGWPGLPRGLDRYRRPPG